MLIKCIECGKEISDKSTVCPNCGCPTDESIKQDKILNLGSNYVCKNCNNTEYGSVENGGGLFFICKKCGYVDEIIPRQRYEQQQPIKSSHIKCPYCQSINVKKISVTRKTASIVGFGILSNKISKQWHCNNCGSKF